MIDRSISKCRSVPPSAGCGARRLRPEKHPALLVAASCPAAASPCLIMRSFRHRGSPSPASCPPVCGFRSRSFSKAIIGRDATEITADCEEQDRRNLGEDNRSGAAVTSPRHRPAGDKPRPSADNGEPGGITGDFTAGNWSPGYLATGRRSLLGLQTTVTAWATGHLSQGVLGASHRTETPRCRAGTHRATARRAQMCLDTP